MARKRPRIFKPPSRRPDKCEPLSRILVHAFAPGSKVQRVACTSNADFLVHCSTNFPGGPSFGYSVGVKSTGFTSGTGAPVYIVGAKANDVITFNMPPGLTGFITLQTECSAKASIKNV